MLDRFDIILDVETISPQDLAPSFSESTEMVSMRIAQATKFSRRRATKQSPNMNAHMSAADIHEQISDIASDVEHRYGETASFCKRCL